MSLLLMQKAIASLRSPRDAMVDPTPTPETIKSRQLEDLQLAGRSTACDSNPVNRSRSFSRQFFLDIRSSQIWLGQLIGRGSRSSTGTHETNRQTSQAMKLKPVCWFARKSSSVFSYRVEKAHYSLRSNFPTSVKMQRSP